MWLTCTAQFKKQLFCPGPFSNPFDGPIGGLWIDILECPIDGPIVMAINRGNSVFFAFDSLNQHFCK